MTAAPRDNFQVLFTACVRDLAQDGQAALGRMFDLSAQRLVRFSLTIVRRPSDAEDAVQAAFSRIAARPKLLCRADRPWPYLIRTVRNESLKIIQKRRMSRLPDTDMGSDSDSAESVAEREETAVGVRRILESLPTSQYEVVILKHWEELTFAEIAEALGKSQNTVASRYRYAMEKLQRSLEPLVRDGREATSSRGSAQY